MFSVGGENPPLTIRSCSHPTLTASDQICDIGDKEKDRFKKFRFRKARNNAAIIVKVNSKTHKVEIEEEYEDCTLEEIKEDLPDQQPRFILLSYVFTHVDGRVSYPQILIFLTPQGCKPLQQMLYTNSVSLITDAIGINKVFDIRTLEEFTDEWVQAKFK